MNRLNKTDSAVFSWCRISLFMRGPFLQIIYGRLTSYCCVCRFSTAGDWDCVKVVERLPALHYSVDFIFLSFEIMGFIVEL